MKEKLFCFVENVIERCVKCSVPFRSRNWCYRWRYCVDNHNCKGNTVLQVRIQVNQNKKKNTQISGNLSLNNWRAYFRALKLAAKEIANGIWVGHKGINAKCISIRCLWVQLQPIRFLTYSFSLSSSIFLFSLFPLNRHSDIKRQWQMSRIYTHRSSHAFCYSEFIDTGNSPIHFVPNRINCFSVLFLLCLFVVSLVLPHATPPRNNNHEFKTKKKKMKFCLYNEFIWQMYRRK